MIEKLVDSEINGQMNLSARDSQYLTKPEERFGSSMLYVFLKNLLITIMLIAGSTSSRIFLFLWQWLKIILP